MHTDHCNDHGLVPLLSLSTLATTLMHMSQLWSLHDANDIEMTQCKHVRFEDEVTTREIPPYSEAYHDLHTESW